MSLDKNLHLRRRKDGVEVITLETDRRRPKNDPWTPVRYVASGRKGYLKNSDLESDFIMIGKANPEQRWASPALSATGDSAAALETIRERDIKIIRKRILGTIEHPEPGNYATLGDLKPSPNALTALDQAIHMILAGV